MGKPEVVLDRGALARLTAGRVPLDHDVRESLRSGVHGGRQPGGPAADDAEVVERLLGPGPQPERVRQLEGGRGPQRLAVGHEHQRQVVVVGLRQVEQLAAPSSSRSTSIQR